jgi:hypothetical protein
MFARNRGIAGGVVFFEVHVVSKERGLLGLPRTSCHFFFAAASGLRATKETREFYYTKSAMAMVAALWCGLDRVCRCISASHVRALLYDGSDTRL